MRFWLVAFVSVRKFKVVLVQLHPVIFTNDFPQECKREELNKRKEQHTDNLMAPDKDIYLA